MQTAYKNKKEGNSPPLVNYKVHSNTIPDIIDEIDIVEWENGINPIMVITEYFKEGYGDKVRVLVSLTHNIIQVEYDF